MLERVAWAERDLHSLHPSLLAWTRATLIADMAESDALLAALDAFRATYVPLPGLGLEEEPVLFQQRVRAVADDLFAY